MAEERLIDDDKNRKYKIIKNADGEEELIIDTSEEEEEESLDFEVPEGVDDENAADMSPEQFYAYREAQAEAEKRRKEEFAENIARAKELLNISDFDGAAEALSNAEKCDESGELYELKLLAVTRNLSDFSAGRECVKAAEAVKDGCDEIQKKALRDRSEKLIKRIAELEQSTEKLNEENELKKEERRGTFKSEFKRSTVLFAATGVPFLIFLILAISFSTVMYARKDGFNITLTIVFAAIAGVLFLATLFTAHKFWESARNLKLNEKNSSTKIGRLYEAQKAEKEQLTRIYAAFKEENDIS